MRKKRETAKELDQWILIFRCYAEFLRYHFYNSPPLIIALPLIGKHFIKSRGSSLLTGRKDTLLTGVYNLYAPVEMKIKTFLEKAYQNVIKEYSEQFEKGDTKGISIIINALRENAFGEKWVIEGMKNLWRAQKEFRIPRLEDYSSFYGLFRNMRKLEKRAKKESLEIALDYYDGDDLPVGADDDFKNSAKRAKRAREKMKTKYFREFPRKKEIFRIQYLYLLLHKPYYEYKIPPYPSLRTFEKHISKVEKDLL